MRVARDDDLYWPPLPPLEDAAYLVRYLWEVGPTRASGALTYGDVQEDMRELGIELRPWELRLLRRLSLDYLDESMKARRRGRPAPWRAPDEPALDWKAMQESDRRLANL